MLFRNFNYRSSFAYEFSEVQRTMYQSKTDQCCWLITDVCVSCKCHFGPKQSFPAGAWVMSREVSAVQQGQRSLWEEGDGRTGGGKGRQRSELVYKFHAILIKIPIRWEKAGIQRDRKNFQYLFKMVNIWEYWRQLKRQTNSGNWAY